MARLTLVLASACLVSLNILLPELLADSSQPHRFEFSEGSQHYYLVAVLNSQNKQLKGFQLYDSKDYPIQFIDFEEDLSDKIPDYILGNLPSAQPVNFVDCNFDGYPDIMLRDDASKHHESFTIWLWNPRKQKFIYDQALSDAGINQVDPKKKLLYAGGSEGHGNFETSTYFYSRTEKLTLLKTEIIEGSKNSEVTTYYSEEGKATNTVMSVPTQ